jgi:hypothetical protein
MPRTLFLLLFLTVPAAAQEKPAKTYPPDEATLKQIKEQHQALVGMIAKLPDSMFKPDVEVYAKAVEWVTRHEEYWDAKSGEKILAVLAAGKKRAEELGALSVKSGTPVPSWMKVRGKPVVFGYKSSIDDSVQPYSVTYPLNYDQQPTSRKDFVLHGRDATLTEVKFIAGKESAKPAKESVPYVQIDLYGRGNNAYRWAGETDLDEVRTDVSLRAFATGPVGFGGNPQAPASKPVTILRGFSMGGAGTWHIGLHHPFMFNAIGPGAGFSVTKGYVKNLPDPLPDYVDRCLRIYDAADYAENAFHTTVVAYAGDKDPQQAATKNVQERLKAYPEIPPITFIVGKDLEHKMPPEYMAQAETEYEKNAKVRATRTAEKTIRFVTYTAKYGAADWIRIEGLDRHYDRTLVEATWDEKKPVLKTTNVRRLSLIPTAKTFYARNVREVEIDGQTLPVPDDFNGADGRYFNRRYVKVDGKWALSPRDDKPFMMGSAYGVSDEKVAGLQGPIDDAFAGRFYVKAPTGPGWNADIDQFLTVSHGQFSRVWDKYFRSALPRTASEFKQPPSPTPFGNNRSGAEPHMVLFGDPQSNPLIAQVLPKLPITWTKDKLVVNGKTYDPATHLPVMIYPNPLNPGKYVVLNTGHTFSEKDLQGTNALLYPHLGDWAVIKPKPTAKEPWAYEVVDAGLFDEFWQFPKK